MGSPPNSASEAVALQSDLSGTVVGSGTIWFDVTGGRARPPQRGESGTKAGRCCLTGTGGVTLDSSEAPAGGPRLLVDHTCGVRTLTFAEAVDTVNLRRVSDLARGDEPDPVRRGGRPDEPVPDSLRGPRRYRADADPARRDHRRRRVGRDPHRIPGDGFDLHRMLLDWDDTATWDGLGGGVQTDGSEAVSGASIVVSAAGGSGVRHIDVTADLRAWLAEPANAYGWVGVSGRRESAARLGGTLRSAHFARQLLLSLG